MGIRVPHDPWGKAVKGLGGGRRRLVILKVIITIKTNPRLDIGSTCLMLAEATGLSVTVDGYLGRRKGGRAHESGFFLFLPTVKTERVVNAYTWRLDSSQWSFL